MLTFNQKCPLCAYEHTEVFLRQDSVPVHQNLIFRRQEDAVQIRRGNLTLSLCKNCGFVFNSTFNERELFYGQQYDNTQLSSPYFQDYVNGLVHQLIEESNVRNARIVEIGCGKGDFLRALVKAEGANNRGIGFDPSYSGPDSDLDGRLHFERRFYDESCANVPADIIICRHVLEHISNPVHLLSTIRVALTNSPNARLFFETPSLEWILRHEVFWDVFYEHCSYFTVGSLTTAFESAGFYVDHVSPIFGGQYLWLAASNHASGKISKNVNDIPASAQKFGKSYTRRIQEWQSTIQSLTANYRVALWGAGAKGVTCANLVDPRRGFFPCIVDLNVSKQGGYLPGTGHPIISEMQLIDYGIDCAIVLNPNYFDEVQSLLRLNRLPIKLMNIGAE